MCPNYDKLEAVSDWLLKAAYEYAGQALPYGNVLADEQHPHRESGPLTPIVYITITPRERYTNTFRSR